jgi:hypothetical protein
MTAHLRRIVSHARLWPFATALVLAVLLSCHTEDEPTDTALSPDETYLVESYVRVRRAGAMFPHQRVLADSLLDKLAGEVDTVRVARTIAALNTNPERWTVLFQAIEQRMSESNTQRSESTRS